jgi:putative colanic acid biosynthesis acetyltransferase WcaF
MRNLTRKTSDAMKLYQQKSIYDSPWSFQQKVKMLFWVFTWTLLCSWTPKPLNKWRMFWLRLFGATLNGQPFIHQRARIQIPWNLTMHDRACIGDRANVYSLGPVELGRECTVAQECYLCAGTHDFADTMFLMTAKITIGARAFLGARTFVLPGVTVGDDCLIGACSVVTRDTPAGMVCAGNPAKVIRPRYPQGAPAVPAKD